MKIIRIEHKVTKTGVYTTAQRPETLRRIIRTNFTFGDKHPTPEKDSLFVENALLRYPAAHDSYWGLSIYKIKFLKFGFADKNQLRAWFYDDGVFRLMHDANFHIVEIEVKDAIIGHTQVAYDSTDDIISQTEHNILEYLNIK